MIQMKAQYKNIVGILMGLSLLAPSYAQTREPYVIGGMMPELREEHHIPQLDKTFWFNEQKTIGLSYRYFAGSPPSNAPLPSLYPSPIYKAAFLVCNGVPRPRPFGIVDKHNFQKQILYLDNGVRDGGTDGRIDDIIPLEGNMKGRKDLHDLKDECTNVVVAGLLENKLLFLSNI